MGVDLISNRNFNGSRLRDLREAFNLSRKDLADRLNVSEQAVGQYERNMAAPSFAAMTGLKRVFGVDPIFFQGDGVIPKTANKSYIAYRSDLKRSIKNTERETIYLSVVDGFIGTLLKNVNLPDEVISNLSQIVSELFDEGYDIESVAHEVRIKLEIDDRNTNLMAMVEKAGIFVVERTLNEKVDAYSAWTDSSRPYIVLGTNKSGSRRLFDIAHELGHILMHRDQEFDESNTSTTIKMEKEANTFASALLLDKDGFTKRFKRDVKDPTDPEAYLVLKEFYNVSIAALEMRANALGLMESKKSGIFWARMNAKGYKKVEPLDDKIPLYVPGKLYAILDVLTQRQIRNLYSENGITRKFIKLLLLRDLPEEAEDISDRSMYLYQ